MAGRKERFLMEHILNLEQVKKYYGGNSGNITKAVDGISMYVDKGEFVAIMGASGSGKTTLLNCISTIDTVTSGHITVNNQDITKIKDKDFADFRRENLGFIFQDFNLLDTLTIGENISLSLVINKQNPTDIEKRVHAIADKLGIRDILSKFPYEVSGGQKQRCACARALINEPKLILADEPTGALDSKASRLLLETMSEINKKMQATILMVTHDPFSASFCERILFLKDGKIFNEIFRGEKSRKDFFNEILDILTLLGGEVGNTKRNIKDYLIYLITVTTSFSLIFAFNLVASSDEIVKLCSSMDAFKNSLFAVNILITFVICFLINYTTKFMFEKRSKEL